MPVTWPTLRTWTDGDPVHAAYFDQVADAQNYLFRYHRRMTSDITVTSNTTLTTLQPTILPVGDVYIFKAAIMYTSVVGSNGVKVATTIAPAAGGASGAVAYVGANNATPANVSMLAYQTISGAGSTDFLAPQTLTPALIQLRGIYIQDVVNASLSINFGPIIAGNNATMKAGTWLTVERVVWA
jgi:hypothetical protein